MMLAMAGLAALMFYYWYVSHCPYAIELEGRPCRKYVLSEFTMSTREMTFCALPRYLGASQCKCS